MVKTKKHRAYENEYPSVTQILDVLRKHGLEHWFKSNTLEFINKASAKGKSIGTATHEAISHFILTGEAKIETEWPDEVTNALRSFMLFRKENPELKIELSEEPLTSEVFKFNGTLDAPCPPILYDWKSCEKKDKAELPEYAEWRYQASAYVKLWNEHHPDNPISSACIVAIAKDTVAYKKIEINEQEINDCFNEVFLPALKILTYQKGKHFYGKQTASNC